MDAIVSSIMIKYKKTIFSPQNKHTVLVSSQGRFIRVFSRAKENVSKRFRNETALF